MRERGTGEKGKHRNERYRKVLKRRAREVRKKEEMDKMKKETSRERVLCC